MNIRKEEKLKREVSDLKITLQECRKCLQSEKQKVRDLQKSRQRYKSKNKELFSQLHEVENQLETIKKNDDW